MVNDQTRMTTQFKAAMHKLELLGQPDTLVDCSDVVPAPPALNVQSAAIPAGFSAADVQAAVRCLSSCAVIDGARETDELNLLSIVPSYAVPDAPYHPWPGDFRPPRVCRLPSDLTSSCPLY